MVEIDVRDKILLTIEEASAICNIGINRMKEITRDPRCSFVFHSGNKRLVKRKKLEEFIDKNLEI